MFSSPNSSQAGGEEGICAGVTNPGSFLNHIPGLCDKAAQYVDEGTPREEALSICPEPGGACWCCCSCCWQSDSIHSLLSPWFGTSLIGFVIKYADVPGCWIYGPAFQTTLLVQFSLETRYLSSRTHHLVQIDSTQVPLSCPAPPRGCKPRKTLGCGGARGWLWLPFVSLKMPQSLSHTYTQSDVSLHGQRQPRRA